MTPTQNSNTVVPIIIGSCKRYSRVLQQVYDSIKHLMPNREVRIITDAGISVEESDFLLVTSDMGWNQNLLKLTAELPESSYVIISMDDLLFTWADGDFNNVIEDLIYKDYDYVSLYAPPAVKLKRALETGFRSCSDISQDHAVSTMVSLIKVGLLREILLKTESPWEFEKNSATFAMSRRCINLNTNLVVVSNLIVKGRRVSWRNGAGTTDFSDIVYSCFYALKVLIYSLRQLLGVRLLRFLLK